MTPAQLRAIRKSLGLTQAQFAEALGFSGQVHISRLERGLIEITPQTALLARYVRRHGVLRPRKHVHCIQCRAEMTAVGGKDSYPADGPASSERYWHCFPCNAVQAQIRPIPH